MADTEVTDMVFIIINRNMVLSIVLRKFLQTS